MWFIISIIEMFVLAGIVCMWMVEVSSQDELIQKLKLKIKNLEGSEFISKNAIKCLTLRISSLKKDSERLKRTIQKYMEG